MKTAAEILRDLGLPTTLGEGRHYVLCPRCSHTRSQVHQKAKCLGVTIDDNAVQVGCNHCGWTAGQYFNGKANGVLRATTKKVVVEQYEYLHANGSVLFVTERVQFQKPDGT